MEDKGRSVGCTTQSVSELMLLPLIESLFLHHSLTRYLLRGHIEFVRASYSLTFQMQSSCSGQLRGRAQKSHQTLALTGPLCPPQDFTEISQINSLNWLIQADLLENLCEFNSNKIFIQSFDTSTHPYTG